MIACPDGCGACCDPVVLPFGPADLRRLTAMDLGVEDYVWMKNHLTPMTRREGLQRAAYLTQGGKTTFSLDAQSQPEVGWSYFYECDLFDTETRRCSDYEHRPPTCRGFPWYDDDTASDQWNKAKALPTTCVHRAAIGQPVEPVPVRITRKP